MNLSYDPYIITRCSGVRWQNNMPLECYLKEYCVRRYDYCNKEIDYDLSYMIVEYLVYFAAQLGHLNVVKRYSNEFNQMYFGAMPIHYAALGGHLDVVRYLVEECHVDPMEKCKMLTYTLPKIKIDDDVYFSHCAYDIHDYFGTIELKFNLLLQFDKNEVPLHLAAKTESRRYLFDSVQVKVNEKGKLETVQYLIEHCHCDPLAQDSDGNTALHYAIMGDNIEMIHYLLPLFAKLGSVPYINSNGDSLLHIFCYKGYVEAVQCRIEHCHCDPLAQDSDGNTAMHYAIMGDNIEMIHYLLPLFFRLGSVSYMNSNGDSLLHIFCRKGYVTLIEQLLSSPKVDTLGKNNSNQTPLMVAADSGTIDIVAPLFAKFGKIRLTHSVGSYVNIFLLGNSGAGKTTLAQVIKDRASHFFKFGKVKTVDLLTAGIVPTKLQNTELGSIILHDFAGQTEYYSSHVAFLESLLKASGTIIVILVNLTQDVLQQIQLWWTLVSNECHKVLSECHILVIGSHADEVSDDECRAKLLKLETFASLKSTEVAIKSMAVFTLNCCARSGQSINKVLSEMVQHCSSIRNQQLKQISLYCNFLYSIIDGNKTVLSLNEVNILCVKARELEGTPLPHDITPLLVTLDSCGLIIYLENEDPLKSWVIIHKECLLTEVNGVLFAPTHFSEHCNIASNTGIVTSSAISQLFKYPIDMLISFLQNMKLCQEIDPRLLDISNLTLQASDNSDTENIRDKILFFPAFIANKRTQDISGQYKIGWCLQCQSSSGHFFSIRFLHILLLHLAYRFTLPNSKDEHSRLCSFWINGIHWHNNDGVEALVELLEDNQCLLMLMSCDDSIEHVMMQQHCALVKEITSLQQEYCPVLQCEEWLIDTGELQYPMDHPSTLTRYSMEQVLSSIGRQSIVSENGNKRIPTSRLLVIEPETFLSLRSTCTQEDTQPNTTSTSTSVHDGSTVHVTPDTDLLEASDTCNTNTLGISDLVVIKDSVQKIVDWKELGLRLGIHYDTLEKIDEEQRGKIENCKREMLAAWLKGEDNAKEQTWSTLASAVGYIEQALSETMRENHK